MGAESGISLIVNFIIYFGGILFKLSGNIFGNFCIILMSFILSFLFFLVIIDIKNLLEFSDFKSFLVFNVEMMRGSIFVLVIEKRRFIFSGCLNSIFRLKYSMVAWFLDNRFIFKVMSNFCMFKMYKFVFKNLLLIFILVVFIIVFVFNIFFKDMVIFKMVFMCY